MAAGAQQRGSWRPDTGLPSSSGKASMPAGVPAVPNLWQRERVQGGGAVPPLDVRQQKKLGKAGAKQTAGTNWFDMPAPTMTPELTRELQLLRLRGVLDPKRHYKKESKKKAPLPKFFQIGTVVAAPADFYSGRLTKKERKLTFADELLADSSLKKYAKRKFLEIQAQKEAGGKKFWKQKTNRRKPSWAKN